MDPRTDGERFKHLINQFHAAYREGREATDAFRDVYWNVLKDLSYDEVKAAIDRAIATAKPETSMPRPAALRSRPLVLPPVSTSVSERAERLCSRNWADLQRRDPVAHQIEWRLAVAAKHLVDPEDEEHSEWVAEYRRWNKLRYAPRAEQEAAVNKVLGR